MEPGSKPTVTKLVWRRHHTAAVVLIAVVTFAAHGWSLDDGLFLDDHWHQLKLREAEWSIRDLIDSTTIEPARWIHAWWQDQEVRWDYSRPVTMAWMKLVQDLSGGSVPLQHLSCIAWHFVCCVLVYVLCMRVTCSVFWSVFAGILFVIYPHNVYAVSWLAAQNAVIQTTLTLGAVLCYLRVSGSALSRAVSTAHRELASPGGARVCSQGRKPLDMSPPGHEAPEGRQIRELPHAGVANQFPTLVEEGGPGSGALPARCLVAALILFILSLFARENAVVLPALLMAFDAAFGGWKFLQARWKWHAVLWLLAAAFVVWRITAFDSRIPEIYLRRPEDATYLPWLLAKLLHYVVCVIWEAPMMIGPTRYADPFTTVPWDCALMICIVLVLGGGFWLACRRQVRGYWLWGVWILLAILPVLPIMATPHSAYLPGVAFVIAVVLKPAVVSARRAPFSTAMAWWMMGMSVFAFTVYRFAWQSLLAAERYTIAQMTVPPPPPPDSDVFIMNLPLVNIYLPVNLWQAWGYSSGARAAPAGPAVHVLTFSTDLLRGPDWTPPQWVESPEQQPEDRRQRDDSLRRTCPWIDKINAYSFVVTSDHSEPYFAGVLGEFLTRGMRRAGCFTAGEVIQGGLFRVEILASGLKFTFPEPLTSERYRFFAVTEDCPGAVLDFSESRSRQPAMECPALAGAAEYAHKRDVFSRIIVYARRIIRTDLYLTDHQW